MIEGNILFGTLLLEAMVATGVSRLVNTGTAWQHFEDVETYRPVCLHAATKQAFEDILAYYVDARGLEATSLMLYDTYGPGDPRPKLISLLKKQLHADAALNMSSGEQIPLRKVVDLFSQVAGKPIVVNWGNRPYRDRGVMKTGAMVHLPCPVGKLGFGWLKVFEKSSRKKSCE